MRKTKRQTAKENLQSIGYALAIFLTIMFLALCSTLKAQNVVRNGKTFIEKVDTTKSVKKTAVETDYIYIDKNGVAYTVYLSSGGKAFIVKTSKKTGKQYRQYLPKVTEELNK